MNAEPTNDHDEQPVVTKPARFPLVALALIIVAVVVLTNTSKLSRRASTANLPPITASPAGASQPQSLSINPASSLASTNRSGQGQGGWQDWFNLTQKEENNPFGQAVIAEAQRMQGRGSGGRTIHQSQPNSTFEREAIEIASQIFAQAWTQMGDSWFAHTEQAVGGFIFNSRHIPGMFQMKSVSFQISPLQISEADSLNGIEWAGDVTISSRVHRKYIDENHQWEGWNNGTPQYMEIGSTTYRLIRKQGSWIKPENPHPNVFRRPSTEEVNAALTGRPTSNSTNIKAEQQLASRPKDELQARANRIQT